MITARIKFKCIMPGCGNAQSFYIMPLDEKIKSGDFIHSPNKYRITCQKCGENYLLQFDIRKLRRSK